MELLVTADDVRARMALDDTITENIPVLESAIQGAQMRVADILMTPLEITPNPVVDIFVLNKKLHVGLAPAGLMRLFLSRGFVRSDYTPIVEYAQVLLPSVEGQWASLPGTDYVFDREKGIVSVAEAWDGYFIRVRYKAGFTTQMPTPDTIPDWLREAIISMAPAITNFGAVSKRTPEISEMYRQAAYHAGAVISPYVRPRSFVLSPILSQ